MSDSSTANPIRPLGVGEVVVRVADLARSIAFYRDVLGCTVEREQALWLASHYPDQRVYVTGSTRFWLNAFSDSPQLDGGFGQGVSNPAIPDITFAIPYGQTYREPIS